MKSFFIVLEGADCSGKTTIIQKVVAKLQMSGLTVIDTLQPGGTPLGEKIRPLLLYEKFSILPISELLLFLADRYQHSQLIAESLQKYQIVICDRYFYSTFVYQSLIKDVNWDLVFQLHQQLKIFQLLPDLVFFLETDPDKLYERHQKTKNQDRFCKNQNHQKFYQMNQFYRQVFQKLNKYYHHLEILQNNSNPDELAENIVKIIKQRWKKHNLS